METQRPSTLFDTLVLRVAAFRVVILFLFHAVVFAGSYAFAWLVRFEFEIPDNFLPIFTSSLPVVVGVQLLMGALFGFYRGWWRYVGFIDVQRLLFGVTAALAILLAGWFAGPMLGVDPRFVRTPRGVLLIDWAFALLNLFGARMLVRLARDRFRPSDLPSAARRVLIVGAGDAGETLAREVEHRPQLRMKVVGFVDDHKVKRGSQIRGIEVFGPISDIAGIAQSLEVEEILLAIPSASGKRLREIIQHVSAAGVPFKTVPGIDQLMAGKVHVSQLRPVNMEDLVRREKIDLLGDPVREMIRGSVVLVTGAGGTVGAELAHQVLALEPARLVLIERSELALYDCFNRLRREGQIPGTVSGKLADVGDRTAMGAILTESRPRIVLHAAAHKHVPLGEENPAEYLRNNALATRTFAEACAAHGVERFVLISTDKAINPTSIMGATKRAAEILLLDLGRTTPMITTAVRFGNVIGSSGSVVPMLMEQIAAGGPVTVTDPEARRYFIRTSEAISLVLQTAALGDRGCIFMLDMGEPVRIVDLARDLIRLSNHTEEEIAITFTGLRPGEKLFEEIRLEGESIRKTSHPQIVITECEIPDPAVVRGWLQAASHLDSASGAAAVRQLLERLVTEFAPARAEGAMPAGERTLRRDVGRLPAPA